jgi:hypothetical protein
VFQCDYRRGFGSDIGFIYHLYRQLRTASNYSAIANLHILQITTAHAKFFQPAVFTSRSLVTASNSGDSSASALKSSLNGGSLPNDTFLHRLPYRTDLVAPISFLINTRHGPGRQQRSFSYVNRFHGNVFTESFPSSGRLFLFISNLLPSTGSRSAVCFAAVA